MIGVQTTIKTGPGHLHLGRSKHQRCFHHRIRSRPPRPASPPQAPHFCSPTRRQRRPNGRRELLLPPLPPQRSRPPRAEASASPRQKRIGSPSCIRRSKRKRQRRSSISSSSSSNSSNSSNSSRRSERSSGRATARASTLTPLPAAVAAGPRTSRCQVEPSPASLVLHHRLRRRKRRPQLRPQQQPAVA